MSTATAEATATLPQRTLGRTGERVPLLGLGSAPGGMGLEDGEAIALYERAIDLGVTYIDTAPGYGRAQKQLGQIVARRRSELFLVTKTPTSKGEEARRQLEENLRDLRTECVDLVYVHSLGHQDVDQVLAPGGALEGLRRAQEEGLTRYVGFSAHNQPWKAARVLREAEVDIIMLALNYADRHTYNFEEEVLPLARARQVGVAAMKVYGGARGMEYESPQPSALTAHGPHDHRQALRYALGLPGVHLAVIGVFDEGELLQNVEWARDWEALAAGEEGTLLESGREIARAWGPHYGPVR